MSQKGFDFGDEPPARGAKPAPSAAPAPPSRKPAPRPEPVRRRALTVSELTDRIQGVLETEFLDVWVEGEISNLKLATSGHWYFSLKDEQAQVAAVVWRNDTRLVRFRPKDGMRVLARGQLRVYPPRGAYQLSVQVLEPLGKGSLQQAFEELKQKLEQEGLFDPARKRPLPMLPRRIGVVTSPTGAVLRDILRVLRSRYADLEVLVYPARVQGDGAAAEIAQGIRALNRLGGLDVILVARGGGSLEDLWAFNEEGVARAIAASAIPTISAVGHETDFTIADFVADLRAATPSAAAERVVQAKEELQARVRALDERRDGALRLRLARVRARVEAAAAHRVFAAERGRLRTLAQRIDELVRRAETGAAAGRRARAGPRAAPARAARGVPLRPPARRAARAARAPARPAGGAVPRRDREAALPPRPAGRLARRPLAARGARPRLRARVPGGAGAPGARRRRGRSGRGAPHPPPQGALRATIVSKETE